MQIQLIENSQIDKKKWDSCAQQSIGFELYMHSSYLDLVYPDWKALIAGDYEAIFPIFENKFFIWNKLVHPLFTGPLSILGTNLSAITIIKNWLAQSYKNYSSIDIKIYDEIEDLNKIDSSKKILQQLSLVEDTFSPDKQLRKNIQKANKAGFINFKKISANEFISGIRENLLKHKNILSQNNLNLLNKIINGLDLLSGECFGLLDDSGKIHAGQFYLKGEKSIYFILCFSTPEGKKNGAMHSLLTNIIQTNLPSGGTVNFGGSSIESIAKFNYNFGAKDVGYSRAIVKKLPFTLIS